MNSNLIVLHNVNKKNKVIVFPNAKINLGLAITAKRSDGFHNLETVFYPIGLCDTLEILAAPNSEKAITFSASGIPIPGDTSSNLCIAAYNLVAKDYRLPAVKIHLHKKIPIGAGLGGGSSDAAFFLKALNSLFELNLSFGELHHYARMLGSDCSFFINNQPVFATGKGDEMEAIPLSLSGKYLVLIKPDIPISTKEAYSNVIPKNPINSIENSCLQSISSWRNSLHNQFEDTIFKGFPEISKIKEQLYAHGAIYASMSGSGSSVYGIFDAEIDLSPTFKGNFIWQETLR